LVGTAPADGSRALAGLRVAEDGEAQGRGEIRRFAGAVEFFDEGGEAKIAVRRQGFEAVPEFGFERNRGAVAGDGQRALLHQRFTRRRYFLRKASRLMTF